MSMNGMTNLSKRPNLVLNVVFQISFVFMWNWWYPTVKYIFVKEQDPCKWSRKSSIRGKGYHFFYNGFIKGMVICNQLALICILFMNNKGQRYTKILGRLNMVRRQQDGALVKEVLGTISVIILIEQSNGRHVGGIKTSSNFRRRGVIFGGALLVRLCG